MRITNNMLINNIMLSLSNNLNRTQKYQSQLATGKKITMPSDDPIVASKAQSSEPTWLRYSSIGETPMMPSLDGDNRSHHEPDRRSGPSVQEISVQASNGTNSEDDIQKIRAEAEELRSQLIHLANTTYAGRHIFSGYKTDKPLLDDEGNFNVNIANSEQIKFEIGIGDDINVNVPGSDLFHRGANAAAGDKSSFVDTFDKVIDAMESGDYDGISSLLEDLDLEVDNMLRVRAGLGARMNRVELTSNRLDDDNVNFTRLMSLNEDVDMAEAIMNLVNERSVYQPLSTSAKVIQESLWII